MWRLARNSGGLDLNSSYTYLMLAHYFAETCAVARDGERAAGFVAGFRPPTDPGTMFVWQITVDPALRERGVGRRMLAWLLARLAPAGVDHLEASMTPSNEPSQRMFRGLARELAVPCEERMLFASGDFPEDEPHEAERLVRIGPFSPERIRVVQRTFETNAPATARGA